MEATTIMEGSTGELLIDAENLLEDTKERIKYGQDPDRSREIQRCELRLALKNMKQCDKI